MSILVSTFQIMGTIVYCGTEAYLGFKHVPLVSLLPYLWMDTSRQCPPVDGSLYSHNMLS